MLHLMAVFDWSEMGQAVEQLLPFIGPSEHVRRAFLDPDFLPVAMRRTIDQRIVTLTS